MIWASYSLQTNASENQAKHAGISDTIAMLTDTYHLHYLHYWHLEESVFKYTFGTCLVYPVHEISIIVI